MMTGLELALFARSLDPTMPREVVTRLKNLFLERAKTLDARTLVSALLGLSRCDAFLVKEEDQVLTVCRDAVRTQAQYMSDQEVANFAYSLSNLKASGLWNG